MKSRRILVVANFPPPLRGVTTLGPGLRAFSLARGLARAGHEVSLCFSAVPKIPEDILRDSSRELPLHATPVAMSRLGEFILEGLFEFVIMTNYPAFTHIIDDIERDRFPATRFIYDFFAPRILEETSNPQADPEKIAAWISLKQRALRAAWAVLVNGSKKIPYVTAWLLASNADLGKPLIPAGFAIDTGTELSPLRSSERDFAVLPPRALLAGNRQRWTDSQLSTLRLLQALADNRWELVACGKPTFAELFTNGDIASRFNSVKIEGYASLPFDAFCDRQASCDLIVDAFARTPERELAYVTRTAVALSGGLPAIHPAWTETGEIIRCYGAGWLYEDEEEIPKIIEWISRNPQDLASKKSAAAKLRRRQFNEACSVARLSAFLQAAAARRSQAIRKRANRTGSPQSASFLHSILDPDWYAVRHGLPLIDVHEAPADYFERHATAARSAPNFLLAYLQQRLGLGDVRLIAAARLVSLLEGWLDTAWLRPRFSLEQDSPSQEVIARYFARPGNDPNRFFSEVFYSTYYPDAGGCVRVGAYVNGYDHYLTVGQHKGYLPSPFVIGEQPDAGQGSAAPDLFASVVTDVANLTVSPTPFFDLSFWRESSAGAANGTSLGAALVSFIDSFSLPGVFGSSLHREALRSNGQAGHASAEQLRRQAWASKLLDAYGQRGSL